MNNLLWGGAVLFKVRRMTKAGHTTSLITADITGRKIRYELDT
jgi:hypothetical protein